MRLGGKKKGWSSIQIRYSHPLCGCGIKFWHMMDRRATGDSANNKVNNTLKTYKVIQKYFKQIPLWGKQTGDLQHVHCLLLAGKLTEGYNRLLGKHLCTKSVCDRWLEAGGGKQAARSTQLYYAQPTHWRRLTLRTYSCILLCVASVCIPASTHSTKWDSLWLVSRQTLLKWDKRVTMSVPIDTTCQD